MKKIFFIIIITLSILVYYIHWKDVYIDSDIVFSDDQGFDYFFENLSDIDSLSFRLFFFFSEKQKPDVIPWLYRFDWKFSKEEVISIIEAGPVSEEVTVTILEWRSIYDIDYSLSNIWIIQEWDYIDYVNDNDIIDSYIEYYDFLSYLDKEVDMNSFEWFLYPNSYKIDLSLKNPVKQLVIKQLNYFELEIWEKYKDKFLWFSNTLDDYWYNNIDLDFYDIINLASIIEKEENYIKNKYKIAWVFLNRIENWRRLDADISLCYWLEQSYRLCTQQNIIANLWDASNSYNTRKNFWLPPTPIASPHISSIEAILNFEYSNDFFYLHDSYWKIHTAETLQEHNLQKSKYINS